MAARLDQTVLVFQPQWVAFSAGTNDALRDVIDEQYEKALREIVAKVQARGGRLVLLTPCEILRRDGKTPEEQEARRKKIEGRLASFEAIIRKVAAEEDCRVAENRALMLGAIRSGKTIMTEDGIHPNYRGQGDAWTGFHAGKERIAVKLRAGVNRLVVETGGPHFFIGVSDEPVWEGQLR